MKVLMYGWEFPPFISGGLGVACHAMVQELAKKSVNVAVVLPYTVENTIDTQKVSIVGCDVVENAIDYLHLGNNIAIEKVKAAAFLRPYLEEKDPNYLVDLDQATIQIEEIIHKLQTLLHIESIAEIDKIVKTKSSSISGKYGMNLLAEVYQYAVVAGAMAVNIPHDVIHAHDWLTVLAGVEAKKRSHKPLVFHVHALEPDRSGTHVDTRIFAIEKFGMQQADQIVAVSQYTKNVIVEKYGIPANKVKIIHNGTYANEEISFDSFSSKTHKMVLFLGRLAHQKGPFQFLQAARKILEKRQDVHFVIAGTGSLLQEMVNRVAALHIGKYVHFIGFIDNKKIAKIFNLADVYVMPSVSEPFGLSCLEALSFGVPVVISKQSGVAEVLNHVAKVDFWDVNEMANKILALIDHKALSRAMLNNTAKELEDLTWEKTANSLIGLYSSLTNSMRS